MLVATGLAATAWAADVRVAYALVFPKLPIDGAFVPVRITVSNDGPSLRGTLFVEDSEAATALPIDVPRGSKKSMTVYAYRGTSFSDFRAVLEYERGTVSTAIEGPAGGRPPETVVFVGDTSGALNFLPNAAPNRPVAVDSCLPEAAPERSVGYAGATRVILGDGAERISDAAVRALVDYAMSGGEVVIVGGARTPLANDDRWAAVSPVRDGKSVPRQLPPGLAGRLGATPGATVTALVGTVRPGSLAEYEDGVAWIVRRRVGAGEVVLWAVDPFETVNRGWKNPQWLVMPDKEAVLAREREVRTGSGTPGQALPAGESGDPFQVELPAPQVVLGAIVLYGLVVVPATLLGLNKLGRAPLAWAVLPAASLLFAAVVFASAEGVNKAKSARSTGGYVYVDGATERAYYVGNQQVFFARSGEYDFRLRGVEACVPRDFVRVGSMAQAPWRGNIVDTGEVGIRSLPIGSLTFRDVAFHQKLARPGEVLVRHEGGKLVVVNRTPWDFAPGRLVWEGGQATVPRVQAGASARAEAGQLPGKATSVLYVATSPSVPVGFTALPESEQSNGPTVVWRTNGEDPQ